MRTLATATLLLVIGASAQSAPVDHCGLITTYELNPTFSGNTIASFGNNYKVNTCAGTPAAPWLANSGASDEQVVKLRVLENCTASIQVTGQASGGNLMDPAIYVGNSCPPEVSQQTIILDSSCLASADATGQLGVETLSLPLLAGQDYFLYIDGFLAARGPYQVQVTGCTLTDDQGMLPPLFRNGFEPTV